MNYLAHLFLADDDDDSLIGNLLGDFVKGRPGPQYNADIVAGIMLHRKVDAYADAHGRMKASRNCIASRMRRFAGIIIDVCYDHFLSRHWRTFSDQDLDAFIGRAYDVLQKNKSILPDRLRRILPYMIAEDWLGRYIELKSVGTTLDRITLRLTNGRQFRGAIVEVEKNYDAIESDFLAFFPDLAAFTMEAKQAMRSN